MRPAEGIDGNRDQTPSSSSSPSPEHRANGLLIQSVSCAVKSWDAVGRQHRAITGWSGGPATLLIAPPESWSTADRYTPIQSIWPCLITTSVYYLLNLLNHKQNGIPAWPCLFSCASYKETKRAFFQCILHILIIHTHIQQLHGTAGTPEYLLVATKLENLNYNSMFNMRK